MAVLTVRLPTMLCQVLDLPDRLDVAGDTVEGALRDLVRREPRIEIHLFDETGGLRQHVLCFHNQTNTRWMDSLAAPVSDGDVITIIQAVSGG